MIAPRVDVVPVGGTGQATDQTRSGDLPCLRGHALHDVVHVGRGGAVLPPVRGEDHLDVAVLAIMICAARS